MSRLASYDRELYPDGRDFDDEKNETPPDPVGCAIIILVIMALIFLGTL